MTEGGADATPAARLIAALGLAPHPEGGHFRETWRAPAPDGTRAAGTAIYYLLQAGEVSAWHRINGADRVLVLGAYSLLGCTVSPAFEFAGFELAPMGGPLKS